MHLDKFHNFYLKETNKYIKESFCQLFSTKVIIMTKIEKLQQDKLRNIFHEFLFEII